MIKRLFVLIACEESQAECKAFRRYGHVAFSCDIQPCAKSGVPGWHIHGDVSPLLSGKTTFYTQDGKRHRVPRWDLIIAHPPCTYFSTVGSCWLYKNADFSIVREGKTIRVNKHRWYSLLRARSFFMRCLNSAARFVAVENPCPMKIAQLPRPNAFACPSWYGFKYTKKTYYWLRGLPPLFAEYINANTKCLVDCSRGKYRSRTYPGLADAIARQWGAYILDNINH